MIALEVLFWILAAWWFGEMLITAVAFVWMISSMRTRGISDEPH